VDNFLISEIFTNLYMSLQAFCGFFDFLSFKMEICVGTLYNLGQSKQLLTLQLFWLYNGFIKPKKIYVIFLMASES
jgi:hypothetical protein